MFLAKFEHLVIMSDWIPVHLVHINGLGRNIKSPLEMLCVVTGHANALQDTKLLQVLQRSPRALNRLLLFRKSLAHTCEGLEPVRICTCVDILKPACQRSFERKMDQQQ